MLNNVALDVVIGLVFIYLLYSLLATILSEIIATTLGLRARNLKEALNRMLTDEADKDVNILRRFLDSLNIMKNPDNAIINNFYDHPEIKYLGSSGVFRNPSTFKAISFSKTILNVLLENKPFSKEALDKKLKDTIVFGEASAPKKKGQPDKATDKSAPSPAKLDSATATYIRTLWQESYGDIDKFKLQLEAWFDRTMEQATEWYKRKIQIVLLILGFCMAWFFNADTIVMVDKLSTDKDAREKMVNLASAYIQNNKMSTDTPSTKEAQQKLDSLFEVKRILQKNIDDANSLLGVGSWLPDVITVTVDSKNKSKKYSPEIEADLLPEELLKETSIIKPSWKDKLYYFCGLFFGHFAGYLITALAISLGAPFWFDLLNKLMKLRTSQKEAPSTPASSSGDTVSPLQREG